uniref:(northern house mosquito) hypothetical protein n=1 Tax=Culex pipiens TaxID=7175 RepID=A0A8D8CTP0_CULPI
MLATFSAIRKMNRYGTLQSSISIGINAVITTIFSLATAAAASSRRLQRLQLLLLFAYNPDPASSAAGYCFNSAATTGSGTSWWSKESRTKDSMELRNGLCNFIY